MSVRKNLIERARLLAAQQEKKAARLECEARECEDVTPKKLTAAKIAGAAHDRLLDFSPRLGGDFICPECFILRGVDSVLKPNIDRFVETGDDTFDEFRCRECGYKITVSDWV